MMRQSPSSAFVSLRQLHEATADQSERLQEEDGLSSVIGANLGDNM